MLFVLLEYGNPGGLDAGGADFDSGEYSIAHNNQNHFKQILKQICNIYIKFKLFYI